MRALLSDQGTAMAETALCEVHHVSPDARAGAMMLASIDGDWDKGNFHDCTGNDQLFCIACGKPTELIVAVFESHKYGDEVRIFTHPELFTKAALDYATVYWEAGMGDEPMPDDPRDVVDTFFGENEQFYVSTTYAWIETT